MHTGEDLSLIHTAQQPTNEHDVMNSLCIMDLLTRIFTQSAGNDIGDAVDECVTEPLGDAPSKRSKSPSLNAVMDGQLVRGAE
jgi:hypothetical protein